MSDTLFALVAGQGVAAIGIVTFLSCLGLPLPASAMMLAGGAFAAAGDLDLAQVILAAWLGAVLGDQAGFGLGRAGGARLTGWLGGQPARAALIARAQGLIRRRGALGVFLSTWAVAPLGPWVNLAAGAGGLGRARFTLWDGLGETIWVALYVGLGYGFAPQIATLGAALENAAGLVVSGAVALGLGALLWRRLSRRRVHPISRS